MRGSGGTAEAADDARRWDFPEELVAEIAAAGSQGDVEVWRENWDTVLAFASVITQWRVTPAAGRLHYLGLDYGAARAGLELAGIRSTPELWAGVREMEDEARIVLNSGA